MNNSINKGFSRFERNGIIFLSLVIIISIVSKRYVLQYLIEKNDKQSALEKDKIALLQQQINEAKMSYNNTNFAPSQKEYINDKSAIGSFYQKRNYTDFKIEVNSATPADYEKLYGIGKVFAQRIVTFRDKLGGFYALEQLKDVYGIQDSSFKKFKKNLIIKPAKIQKININTASYEELTANPYFFSTIAKQIIGYRTKVRPFANVDDIKNLYFVKDHPEQYEKLSPYVSIN